MNSEFLTLDDLIRIQMREQSKLGKIPSLTLHLVNGEWKVKTENEKSLVEKKVTETKEVPIKQWFTLKEACELKGINLKTACNRPYLKPLCGKEEGVIGGRKSWRLETILKWLNQNDAELYKLFKKNQQPQK
ncbi:MAG: hypothetical protein AMS17_03805 [Spirochaetes bacterium DG_61]|nr:MAG: hypothetical protein AMS17_03805 [Spirochaetes bacterium DG_61]